MATKIENLLLLVTFSILIILKSSNAQLACGQSRYSSSFIVGGTYAEKGQ
jgi:hypothetical protein